MYAYLRGREGDRGGHTGELTLFFCDCRTRPERTAMMELTAKKSGPPNSPPLLT